jgi:pimeloyl-ACP methyl ester carboxylesterase
MVLQEGQLVSFLPLRVPELANAFADLAVSGRAMYRAFAAQPPTEQLVVERLASLLGSVPGPTPENLLAAARGALDRAFLVAQALRAQPHERQTLRPPLGWIAVCGEQDPPHRPVNVSTAAWPQHDVTVHVGSPLGDLAVETRYMVASSVQPSAVVSGPRDLPVDAPPAIGDDEEIFLYVHGHMSRLEEADDLVPAIRAISAERNRPFAVIVPDLPTNGYSTMLEHTDVAPSDATQYPGGYPILQFIEDFILAFIEALEPSLAIKERLAAVIGGSLGGNMSLRLAERTPAPPFLKDVVAWSPASVWNSYDEGVTHFDPAKARARAIATDRMKEAESTDSRHEYFHRAFDESHDIGPIHVVQPQGQQWYRDGWPCKDAYLRNARRERQEIYNVKFRRWHWRVGLEQLIFSHRGSDTAGGRARYTQIRNNVLLASGAADDYPGTGIYSATRELAGLVDTPGESFFLLDTGHSIHNERPLRLASEIIDFMARFPYWGEDRSWRWCQKCEGLFSTADQTVCPAGGSHDGSASGQYSLALDARFHHGQHQWKWCQRCGGLFFSGYEGTRHSTCPAGGAHDGAASGDYSLYTSDHGTSGQSAWKWCQRCEGLFFSGFTGTRNSTCPADGAHDGSMSSDYTLTIGE